MILSPGYMYPKGIPSNDEFCVINIGLYVYDRESDKSRYHPAILLRCYFTRSSRSNNVFYAFITGGFDLFKTINLNS